MKKTAQHFLRDVRVRANQEAGLALTLTYRFIFTWYSGFQASVSFPPIIMKILRIYRCLQVF